MSFQLFTHIWSHVMRKRKKRGKKSKFKNFEKKIYSLGIWWIGVFSQNLALIPLTVSEKTGFTDGCPRDDSSSVVQ